MFNQIFRRASKVVENQLINGRLLPLKQRIQIITRSRLFDCNWYREINRLPSESMETDVVKHYIIEGNAKRLAPHPLFDVRWYPYRYPDANWLEYTMLEHYIVKAGPQGGAPTPLFEPQFYRERAGAQLNAQEDPFFHFLHVGALKGISPHPLFDSTFYFRQYPYVATSGMNPLTDFEGGGAWQGRNPNRYFDCGWYLAQNPQLVLRGLNPLSHFITEGAASGLNPHPDLDLDQLMALNESAPSDRLQALVWLLNADPDGVNWGRRQVKQRVQAPTHDVMTLLETLGVGAFFAEDCAPAISTEPIELPAVPHNIELVTVDIWDTVLRRDCHPDEIKLQTARFLYLEAFRALKPPFRSVRALFESRIFSENASANNDQFEYRQAEAFDLWVRTVVGGDLARGRRETLVKSLIAHEAMAELRATRVDGSIREWLHRLKTQATFVSDFYASQDFIRKLLKGHGLDSYFVSGYVSSDTLETKRSGELFDRVSREMEVIPDHIYHIGDNLRADVVVPKARGLTSYHYNHPHESARKDWFDPAFAAWSKSDLSVHERRVVAGLEEIAVFGEQRATTSLRAYGVRLAPIAVSYVLSIIESAAANGANEVWYFTREGQLFCQIHDALVAADPYNIKYARASILEVSRRATFAASLSSVNSASLMRIWTLYSKQSLRGLASSLNLDAATFAAMAAEAGLNFDEVVVFPWKHPGVKTFLASQKFQNFASADIARQRKTLLNYLATTRFAEERRSIISDIGWRGTIQDNLAHLLGKKHIDGWYLGLFNYLNPQQPNTTKVGWLFDEPAGRSPRIGDVAPFEMIFNGPGGSVVGYAERNGAVQSIRHVVPGEEAVIVGPLAELQEGMLSATRFLADYIRLHGLTAEDLRPLSERLGEALAFRPPAEIADMFAALHHNETFGVGAVEVMSERGGVLSPDCELTGSELHSATSLALKESRWPNGAVRTSEVQAWWRQASPAARLWAPVAVSRAYSPAIIKARGSRLAVYVPAPLVAAGGHRTIFNVVRRLASLGFSPNIYMESAGAGAHVVEEYLGETHAAINCGWSNRLFCDVAMATVAQSARFVAGLQGAHHRGYLVQDFEALFNPISDGYIEGENSYALGLNHFTIGNWLSHVINVAYGASATPAGLGVDTNIYRREQAIRRELAICFLYQPDKPRRTPLLGVETLRLVKKAIPDCKVYVYGSDERPHLDFEVEHLGLVTNLASLNELYNRCTAGLCVSGSNPSRIPYEMMASGCVPVDLFRYNNLLDHRPGTLLLAYQNAPSLAQALTELLSSPHQAETMSKAAAEFAASRTLEWEVDVVANAVLSMFDGGPPSEIRTFEVYGENPVIAATDCDVAAARRFCELQRTLASRRAGGSA